MPSLEDGTFASWSKKYLCCFQVSANAKEKISAATEEVCRISFMRGEDFFFLFHCDTKFFRDKMIPLR